MNEPRPEADDEGLTILKERLKETLLSLEAVKSPVVNNDAPELIKHGGETKTAAIMTLC